MHGELTDQRLAGAGRSGDQHLMTVLQRSAGSQLELVQPEVVELTELLHRRMLLVRAENGVLLGRSAHTPNLCDATPKPGVPLLHWAACGRREVAVDLCPAPSRRGPPVSSAPTPASATHPRNPRQPAPPTSTTHAQLCHSQHNRAHQRHPPAGTSAGPPAVTTTSRDEGAAGEGGREHATKARAWGPFPAATDQPPRNSRQHQLARPPVDGVNPSDGASPPVPPRGEPHEEERTPRRGGIPALGCRLLTYRPRPNPPSTPRLRRPAPLPTGSTPPTAVHPLLHHEANPAKRSEPYEEGRTPHPAPAYPPTRLPGYRPSTHPPSTPRLKWPAPCRRGQPLRQRFTARSTTGRTPGRGANPPLGTKPGCAAPGVTTASRGGGAAGEGWAGARDEGAGVGTTSRRR